MFMSPSGVASTAGRSTVVICGFLLSPAPIPPRSSISLDSNKGPEIGIHLHPCASARPGEVVIGPIESGNDGYENAIDDDGDSEWEDTVDTIETSSGCDPLNFTRVPSGQNLSSCRSLISLMIAGQEPRTGNYVSPSTSAFSRRSEESLKSMNTAESLENTGEFNYTDDDGLEIKRVQQLAQEKSRPEGTTSTARQIIGAVHSNHQAALSPRTTRYIMLATKYTKSLRRAIFWEHQVKSSTANAVLKRLHTSHDITNLKQNPEKAYMGKQNPQTEEFNGSSWNDYLELKIHDEYHGHGW